MSLASKISDLSTRIGQEIKSLRLNVLNILPAYLHDEFNVTKAMTGTDVDWSAAVKFTKTITANTTLTFSNLHVGTKLLYITGDFAITLPTGFTYTGGDRSSTGVTIIQVVCDNASTPTGFYDLRKDES